jgi:hypothetical protein
LWDFTTQQDMFGMRTLGEAIREDYDAPHPCPPRLAGISSTGASTAFFAIAEALQADLTNAERDSFAVYLFPQEGRKREESHMEWRLHYLPPSSGGTLQLAYFYSISWEPAAGVLLDMVVNPADVPRLDSAQDY